MPESGDYGVGFFYLSKSEEHFNHETSVIENVLDELGMNVFCVRDVPVKSSILGKASADCEPRMQQFFVHREMNERPVDRRLWIAESQTQAIRSETGFVLSDSWCRLRALKARVMQ